MGVTAPKVADPVASGHHTGATAAEVAAREPLERRWRHCCGYWAWANWPVHRSTAANAADWRDWSADASGDSCVGGDAI